MVAKIIAADAIVETLARLQRPWRKRDRPRGGTANRAFC
jgi:hypothetical protein